MFRERVGEGIEPMRSAQVVPQIVTERDVFDPQPDDGHMAIDGESRGMERIESVRFYLPFAQPATELMGDP